MATISKINGANDSMLTAQVADTTSHQPQDIENKQIAMDQDSIQEIADRLQESIDRVSKDPHQVAFHKDSQTDRYIIEIKNADGSVVKQFPPEKVLNLMRKLDDLSGMVIDEMT